MRYAFLCLFLFFLTACGENPTSGRQADQDGTQPEPAKTVSEEALIQKLSTALSSDTGRAAEERNIIVNHAIDQLMDLEYTSSGLFYQILSPGEGELLQWADYIKAHYKGYFLDGRVFDSSYKRGAPISFYIGNMIAGWNEGLQLLAPGGKARFIIPSSMAYGEKGFKMENGVTLVPPNTIIAFDVEVLEKLPDPAK